ncbi:MAG TPA: cyclodeaminase/cyclohydrolase family protein [Anaerolineae bacterium]|nr:cyclodeaminase/cyclohydrolase family protein [Anaerolineae bacterium]
MSELWEAYEDWLIRLAMQPLPGGVTVAALSAAMGAALVTKVLRITVASQSLSSSEQEMLEGILILADDKRAELLQLARADEGAYRTVLNTQGLPASDPARYRAWKRATEVPIQLAETCGALLDRLPVVLDLCRPSVLVDIQVGSWLLDAGKRAGVRAAEANLQAWGEQAQGETFRSRLDALLEGELD